jgi:Ca-activated chloride channel family protein
MKGARLDQVKAATNHIIDDLAEEDVVSVVSFSDRCDVVIGATRPFDRRTMKATVSTMRAGGSTAMYEGLIGGMKELSQNLHPRYVNHVMLITDGHTYGDEDACLNLADKAREQGVGISAMGIGDDWNDVFLDDLVSRTGGSSEYVASHRAVTAFLEERIRSLGTAYADNARVIIAPAPQATLDTIFKVSPDPMPLSVDPQPIPLGMLDAHIPTSLILQFSLMTEPGAGQDLILGQALVYADILGSQATESAVVDMTVALSDQPVDQVIPTDLLNALSRLSLFQLQERARHAIDSGNPDEASRRLEMLATRLFEQGEEDLARAAMAEAHHVSTTKFISGEGRKKLKYGTRGLVSPRGSVG